MSQADMWIDNDPEVAVAFQLARAGYDVWFGNNRGNFYSPSSVDFSENSDPKKYYDYGFMELGEYDLPAQIDEVLKVTGVEKLSYIGHSQGTS
jgi:pimeloyl-ACP methyl ester carboxylesterase